jgi:hypothetical protein
MKPLLRSFCTTVPIVRGMATDSHSASVASEPDASQPETLGVRATLAPLLRVIAGMVDLTGFLNLGNIFTAHITGNLVIAAATPVRGGPLDVAQIVAVPVFILSVAATCLPGVPDDAATA